MHAYLANHFFESPTARNLSNLYKSYKYHFMNIERFVRFEKICEISVTK